MSPEEKELLQRTLELTEENNKLLHKVRGVQKREFIWLVLKFIIIIGIALGSLYFIEPYINKMLELYSSITGIEQNIKDVSDSSSSLQDILKNF